MLHIKNKYQGTKKSLKSTLIYTGFTAVFALLGFVAQIFMILVLAY